MLFYNHKHEFIGIDEDGLKLLNYTTLHELLDVCDDVADLFAKEPGYIHNFKSFGWIDFLLHADSDARSAIVHANGRTFSCTLSVHNLYLTANPEENGYMVEMSHIQTISGDDIKTHVITPKIQPETQPTSIESTTVESSHSVLPDYGHITPTPLSEPGTLDIPPFTENDFETLQEPKEDFYTKLSLPLSDEELNETSLPSEPQPIEEVKIERPMLGDVHYTNTEQEFLSHLKVEKSYHFDPNVAAHELGLPVDLIQEFIGDFIQQSYDFKDELFQAVLKNDLNNVKILSHKLKGVAANLRIEDAFETLSVINTSNDLIEIEANLKYFYTIVAKLEGKSVETHENNSPTPPPSITQNEEPAISLDDNDIYALSSKHDEPQTVETIEEISINNDLDTELLIGIKPQVEIYEESPQEITLTSETESQIVSPQEEILNLVTEITEVAPTLHYDKVKISGELGIEHDFFDELITEYKQDASIVSKEISAAIGAFDTHAWKNSAIHLKGISDNLRLNEISEELAILSKTNDAQEAKKASKRLNNFLEQL